MALDLLVVLIYAAAMLVLGYSGMRKAETHEDSLVAGRNLGPTLYMGTMAATVRAGFPPSAPCAWGMCTEFQASGCVPHWVAGSSR